MTFADVVQSFFKIGLTPALAEYINCLYSGACHHACRLRECAEGSAKAALHADRMERHMVGLRYMIAAYGDFTDAVDETDYSLRLNTPAGWHPDENVGLIYPGIFDGLVADRRYVAGLPHLELDRELHRLPLRARVVRG